METALKKHFSLLWDKEELLKEIESRRELSNIYYTWTEEQQQEFVNFCTRAKCNSSARAIRKGTFRAFPLLCS